MSNDPVDYRLILRPNWDSTCRIFSQTSIDPSTRIGPGSTIWRYTTILADCVIGANCLIADCVSIGRRVVIGEGTRIQHGVAIPDDTVIGAFVFLGANVVLADVDYVHLHDKDLEDHRPPVVEDNVHLGNNCSLKAGIVIHRGAIVGIGAVVTKDVAAGAIVVGNPARVLRRSRHMLINEAGEVWHG